MVSGITPCAQECKWTDYFGEPPKRASPFLSPRKSMGSNQKLKIVSEACLYHILSKVFCKGDAASHDFSVRDTEGERVKIIPCSLIGVHQLRLCVTAF